MRTTLTLDPDVALRLKKHIAEYKLSLKDAVNQALRIGLSVPPTERVFQFQVEPHSFGFKPGVDLDKLNQLVDELEVEEIGKRHS
jgi:hypothetical protein